MSQATKQQIIATIALVALILIAGIAH